MRFVAGAAAVTLLAGGLGVTVQAEAATASHSARSVTWGTCTDPFLHSAGALCAALPVPVNYSNPADGMTTIEISMIKHTSSPADYQGVILTNPGGPGGSGLNLNVFLEGQLQFEGTAADKAAIADYDWIGFDPRGVNNSSPISCDPNYFSGDRRAYNPTSKSLLSYWLKRSADYAKDCAEHGAAQKALLNNDTTVDTAMDMDSIRAALGAPQITYYGFSYGTYLGQVYSTLFPTHVRRIIMDSNVDPRGVWYKANLNQDIAFNRNVNIWFGWLAKYNKIYHLGKTQAAVSRRFYAEQARLAKHPIKFHGRKTVGPDEFIDIFLGAGYYEQTWLGLAHDLSAWATTHSGKAGAQLVADYQNADGPGSDNSFAGYAAVQCTDAQWPTNWARWSRDNKRVNKIAPFETWANAWFNAPCLYWPAKASKPVKINGTGIGNALLIDETLDAATPFEGSLYVRSLFPNSVLLAEPGGTTHADSLSGDLCVDNTIAAYLAYGQLPKRQAHAAWDKTCRPLPKPVGSKNASAHSKPGALPTTRMVPAAILMGR